jgi:predicted Zn-dependent protease
VDYLIQADIDPEAFAHFMFRMAANEKDVPKQLLWISTHPDGEERTQNILNYIAGKEFKKGFVLDSAQWISLKETIHTKE